ncbi:hypothetical protein GHT06_009993 [Daphnia sinensis]|uniref:Serum response factor-binding protein 1 n=1 Tax=Daphnia sinensis TaxID=1820382 RepID=A0AAD5LGV2_9CRUS|nr:hypothetical protein GHT06_009993 [Daphnia sinensis]
MTTINGLEKIALNNQIVRMRKDVKRARLWLINSLTHRVKKLKGSKTSDLEKNQLKAEKLRNKICLLKQICIDEVSKFALCNKNDSPGLSSSESELDLSQKLMLQLANHRLVQQQVQVFRQTYSGPMDRLILLVRALGLQYQKKKTKKLVDCASSQNNHEEVKVASVTPKTRKKKIIPVPEGESASTSECKLNYLCTTDAPSPANFGTLEEIKSNQDVLSLPVEVPNNLMDPLKPSSGFQHNSNFTLTVNNNEHEDLLKNDETRGNANSDLVKRSQIKKILAQKVPWPKFSAPPVNKKIGTMIIKQLNLENEAEAISFDETCIAHDATQNTNRTPRDSFFLGGVDVSSDDEATKNSSILHRIKNEEGTNLEVKDSGDKKWSQQSRSNSRHKLSNRKTQTKPTVTSSAQSTEVLHPSWQAKRKEKQLQIKIGVGQGKKIRFDDN